MLGSTEGDACVSMVIDVRCNIRYDVGVCVGQVPFQQTGLWTQQHVIMCTQNR